MLKLFARMLMTFVALILVAVSLFDGDYGVAKEPSALQRQITDALSSEIPKARLHFGTHKLASKVNDVLLLNELFLANAEAVVSTTQRDRAFGSQAVLSPGSRFVLSAQSLPFAGNWDETVAKFPAASFDGLVRHYSMQAASVPNIEGIIYVYFGIEQTGAISAAIGLSADHQCIPPRQFTKVSASSAKALADLPPKRDDSDTGSQLVLPGEGFLIDSADVAKSEKYFASLDPPTRALMRQAVKTDKSPWLVSEKNIDKFDVDRSAAKKRAVEMWNGELEKAGHPYCTTQ